MAEVARNPSLQYRPPPIEAGTPDIEAVRNGEARLVSCFLRGENDPYPRKPRQGSLVVSGTKATWTPYWSYVQKEVELNMRVDELERRDPDKREGPRGTRLYPVFARYELVTLRTAKGAIDLIVTKVDAPLVLDVFERRMSAQDN